MEMVKEIIEEARHLKAKNRRIRLKQFARMLADKKMICLSAKTIGDILTANDLRAPRIRKKRPEFYQRLRQEIPNGLVSVDGSQIKMYINDQAVKLNLVSEPT